LPLPEPLDVRVYPAATLLRYTVGIGAPETSERGHYAPGEALRLSACGAREDDAPLLARLLARAVLEEAGLADPWLAEGLALLEAARVAPEEAWRLESLYLPALREAVRLDRLPGWDGAPARLEDVAEAERTLRVGQAWQMWAAVGADHGLSGVRALVRGLASGLPLDGALAAVTGHPLAAWEPDWCARVLAAGVPAEALAMAQGFDPERALAAATELASPRYDGRQPGGPGAEAAAWIAGEMAAIGMQPTEGDAYLVGEPISYTALVGPPRLALRHVETGEELALPYPEGFREVLAGCAGAGEAGAGLVWVPGEYRTGWDLGGRVVLKPQVRTAAEEAKKALRAGAGGLILVAPRVDTRTREAPLPGGEGPTLPVALISEETWRGILRLVGLTTRQALDAPPALAFPVEVNLSVPYGPVEERTAYDVVGVLPGARPAAAPLVVAAHYDGVGSLPGGPHYPGANDNAAGAGVLLEAARRLATSGLVPERSIYFVALGAEEADLASTRRLLAAPGAPLDGALGYLLLDGVGNARSYYLTFDGDPARDGRLLHDLTLAAGPVDRRVRPGNYEAANSHDVLHEEGLPAVLLFWPDAYHPHRPEDTPDLLDPHKLATTGEVLTLALYTLSR
jgi:hypothetical protein